MILLNHKGGEVKHTMTIYPGVHLMDGFWSGLAERQRLRKLHGMLCKDCLHDHKIPDYVIEQRLDRQHDATCTMRSPYGGPTVPMCDKHRTKLSKKGWAVTRQLHR